MAKKQKKAREVELTLENVRCFDGAHRVPIRPLTFPRPRFGARFRAAR